MLQAGKKLWLRGWRNRNFRLTLAALIPCLPALLVYLLVWHEPQPFPDSRDYLDLAHGLVEKGQFRFSFDHTVNGEESILRTPGYPFQIAAAELWFGRHGFLVVNLLSLFGLALVTLKLADRLDLKRWYVVTALLVLSPGLMACTASALTEVPFAFWLMLGLYSLIRNRPGWAGLSLGVGTLIRPAGLYLFVVPLVWLLLRRRFWAAAIFLAAVNILPLAWTLRNYERFGYAVYTTLDGHYLLDYKAGSYLSWRDQVPWSTMCERLESQLPPEASPIERNFRAGEFGRQILAENAVGFILWMPRNLVYFLLPDITPLLERLKVTPGNRGTLDLLRRQGVAAAAQFYFRGHPAAAAVTALYAIFYGITLVLAVVGCRWLWRRHRWELFLLLGVIAYLWVVPVGNLDWRFRMPAAALFFTLTAAGVAQWRASRYQIIGSRPRGVDHVER